MGKICAKMVPRNLTEQQRDTRLSAILASKCITVMLQPSCSPQLAPCDFFLFQEVKMAVKGHHFESTDDIRSVMQVINDIPQNALQECYKQWQHCWKRCAQAQGMYFECDHIVVDE
jgi:hypothetical protein